MRRRNVLGELKRRKVLQTAAVYAVTSWLIVPIVATIEEPLSLPDWADTLVIVLLLLAFPIALLLSWTFKVTSDGFVPDDASEYAVQRSRGIEYALI